MARSGKEMSRERRPHNPLIITDFSKANIIFRDQDSATAAAYIIREHKPDLMLLHFLTLDSTHHASWPWQLSPRATRLVFSMAW